MITASPLRASDEKNPVKISSVARWALWFVGLATIAFLPGALNMWELPKNLTLAVGCLFAALSASSGKLPRWLWVITGLAVAVLVASALLGETPVSQLMGRWPRYEGFVTLAVYLAATWCGARLLGPAAPSEQRRLFIRIVACSSIVVGLVALAENLGLQVLLPVSDRTGSLLGNASAQGIVGVMFAALLFFPIARRNALRWRSAEAWLSLIGFLFALATVVLSASRGAIAALFVLAGIASIVWVLRQPSRKRLRASLIVGGALLSLVILVLLVPLTRNRVLGMSPLSLSTINGRFSTWQEALTLWASHPVLGVGPNGYFDAIVAVHTDTWFAQFGSGPTIKSPHNWLLQAAMSGGIPLVLLAVGLALTALIVGIRSWLKRVGDDSAHDLLAGSLLALIGYAFALLTHFTSPSTTLLAAILLGVVVAVHPTHKTLKTRLNVKLRAALLGVWVLFLGFTTVAEIPLKTGVLQTQEGKLDAAVESFTLAHSLRPWDADVTLLAAESFAAATDYRFPGAESLTISWAKRALNEIPSSVSAAKALAVGQQYSGDFGGAETTLERLRIQAPNDPEIYHRLGGILILQGKLSDARSMLERSVVLDPNNLNAWLTLDYLYEKQGDAAGVARTQEEILRLAQ